MTGESVKRRRCGEDALSVLMSSAKSSASAGAAERRSSRPPLSQQPRFVLCPAGCGRHMPLATINLHLDDCIPTRLTAPTIDQSNSDDKGGPPPTEPPSASQESQAIQPSTEDTPTEATDKSTGHPRTDEQASWLGPAPTMEVADEPSHAPNGAQPSTVDPGQIGVPDKTVPPPPQGVTGAVAQNAFTRMLQSSRERAAADRRPGGVPQFFHLDRAGRVHLATQDHWALAGRRWSATVVLRNTVGRRPVELTLSSDLSLTGGPHYGRFVRRHSTLSVPVLKSILQKAVRRRRPRAAVPVAMELADKALGELLRRLPILALEDAALHPDLPLVVWLMMAQTKGYAVPRELVVRVLRLVYEVAACPWKDDSCSKETVDSEEANASVPAPEHEFTLDGFETRDWTDIESIDDDTGSACQLLIWSILARAEYGGMPGDMRMLHRFARVWRRRFAGGAVPAQLVQRLSKDNRSNTSVNWSSIPNIVHACPTCQLSAEQVNELVGDHGMEKLRLQDICLEGIDFHCSPIVDHLLANRRLVDVCRDLRRLSGADTQGQESQQGLGLLLRSCIWRFSAGVNHRDLLAEERREQSESDDASMAHAALWKELVAPEVRRFQTQYVRQRLV